MKRTSLTINIFCIIILVLGNSCKKDNPEPTDISNQYTVITVAGNGTRGSVDGSAASSQFDRPANIVADGQGNIYVSDPNRYCVRKITRDGMVSTFAGGTRGRADGSGTSAQFIAPGGLAVDAQDNIYVADSTRIRKITPSGIVASFTGELVPGNPSTTIPGTLSNYVEGIAIDKQGNIYAIIYYFLKSEIRKITPAGGVSTFIDTTQKFPTPGFVSTLSHITVDGSGNLFVTRTVFASDEIYKISPSKTVTLVASTPYIGGIATNSSGEVFFSGFLDCLGIGSCSDQYRIYKLSSGGKYIRIAGGDNGFADGSGDVARFRVAAGISADAQGNLFVADRENNRIRKISKR